MFGSLNLKSLFQEGLFIVNTCIVIKKPEYSPTGKAADIHPRKPVTEACGRVLWKPVLETGTLLPACQQTVLLDTTGAGQQSCASTPPHWSALLPVVEAFVCHLLGR